MRNKHNDSLTRPEQTRHQSESCLKSAGLQQVDASWLSGYLGAWVACLVDLPRFASPRCACHRGKGERASE